MGIDCGIMGGIAPAGIGGTPVGIPVGIPGGIPGIPIIIGGIIG
jgi:hypothetical protein